MCHASEVVEGTLDALPQLLRPVETPGHSWHVLVHRGEAKLCLLLDTLTIDYPHCIQILVEHLDEHQVFIRCILRYQWSFKEVSCYV